MNTDASLSFGALLRHYRELAGLTQEALAEQAGLTPRAIGALERGTRRHPYPHTLQALATALHLDAEQHDRFVRLARREERTSSAHPAPDVSALERPCSRTHTIPPYHATLPVAPNPLIGREDEVAQIVRAMTTPACRLVTLVGAGGVGKTRLALQVATDLAARFADGVAWVALAPVTTADHVASAIANALHVPLHGTEPAADQVLNALHDRELLLVLDTMEHLLEATPFVAMILEHAASVRLLVTSRERLRVSGEWVFTLQGLTLPDEGTLTEVGATAAVHLFAQRARQVVHAFGVTDTTSAAVARICRLLDGMPLGIELAAAWIGTLSPAEIADELARNLDFLDRADRNAPPRHRSLRAVFDHSWNLLTADEQQVLARLAVFRGGCGRAAAEQVAGASLPVLAALVDKSLIRRTDDATATARYDLHDVVRQYALAKLAADPDEDAHTRGCHCTFYARELGARTEAFLSGTMYAAWMEIAADLDNFRAAWAWAVQQRDHQALAQMGHSMYMLSEIQGLFEEGLAWFREAATALRTAIGAAPTIAAVPNPELIWTLGQILTLYGISATRCGRYGQARELFHDGYALLQQRGDLLARSGTLLGLGYTTYVLGHYDEARTWFTHSLGLARAHGDMFHMAESESMLALIAQAQGADDALALAHAGLADARAVGHPRRVATSLLALSNILLAQGESSGADEAAQEGLQLATAVQDPWATAVALLQLGMIAHARTAIAEARALVEESLPIFSELGEPWSRGRALVTLGWVVHAQGQEEEARTWFEQALHLGRSTHLDPIMLNAQFGLASLMQEDAPAAALAFLEQIITHPATEQTTRNRATKLRQALLTGDRGIATAAQPEAAGLRIPETGETLTPREVEVLHLLAQGCSNHEIAEQLIVAVGTIKRHVNSILGKLHVHSRLEAVARIRDLGLVEPRSTARPIGRM